MPRGVDRAHGRRRSARIVGCMLVVATLALGHEARAAVPLGWDAPEGCPSQAQVQALVDALVDPDAPGHAHGQVTATAGTFCLRLVVETPHGRTERNMEAESCGPLAQAAAVVVAVAVDPFETWARTSVPPAPLPIEDHASAAATPRAVPSSTSVAPTEPTKARPESRRPRALVLGAEAGPGVGLLPRPYAAVHAFGALEWQQLDARAFVTHRLGQLAEQPSGGGAVISTTTLGMALGPTVHHRRWSVRLLATLEAGAMVAAGRGLQHPRTAVTPWLGVGLQPGATWAPRPWIALRADVALTASLTRPQFQVDGGPLIYRGSLLDARIGLGAEFRVPLDQSGRRRGPRG